MSGWRDRLNVSQRWILVIALAAVLVLLAVVIITKGFDGPHGGWYAYSPSTSVVFGPPRTVGPWARWFVWLAAVVTWAAGSLWVLHRPPEDTAEPAPGVDLTPPTS